MNGNQRGSASLEFIVVAVCLLVPLVALTVTTSEIATATFAATSSARQSAREFARAETAAGGNERARAITALAMGDHGVPSGDWSVQTRCSSPRCLRRGSRVTVIVSVEVPLRFVPNVPGITTPTAVTVTRTATARVSSISVAG